WEHSFTYTNTTLSAPVRTVQVHFTNGVAFEALGGFAISHYAADGAFMGNWKPRTQADWALFQGTVQKDWRQLALALERRLIKEAGIPAALLGQFSASAAYRFAPDMGSYGLKRLCVQWRPNGSPKIIRGRETSAALSAEFDLGTGELISIAF